MVATERNATQQQHALHDRELRLVGAALRGDPAAREALVPYLARIPSLVARFRSHSALRLQVQDESDLIQDCMALVWRKLPQYQGRAALSTWIWRLCDFELRNGFRRLERGRRTALMADELNRLQDPTEESRWRIRRLDLRAATERLGELQRQIVRARHERGLTVEAVARELGRPIGQIKSQYLHALRRLRDYLRSRDWSPEDD